MEAITVDILSTENKTAINNLYGRHLIDRTANYIKNAYYVDYCLTDAELSELQRISPHRLILVNPTAKQLKNIDHPIPAILNDMAYDHIRSIVHEETNMNFKIFEIGGRIMSDIKVHHTCNLYDARSNFRYANNTKYRKDQQHIHAKATIDPTISVTCDKGAQNCFYKADAAISINSLYDFTFDDIIRTFDNHGILRLHCWMYLPLTLIDSNFKTIEEKFFNIKHIEGKFVFSVDDYSFVYQHDYHEWRKWLTHTKIETETFDIVWEIKKSYGCFHYLYFQRIPHSIERIMHSIPLHKLMNNYVIVPNLRYYVEHNLYLPESDIPKLVIPRKTVYKMLGYASRQLDDKYHWTGFATVMQGELSSVRIGSIIVYQAWEPDFETFNDSVFTLFIMGAIYRTKRTTNVSEAFNYIRKYHNDNILTCIRLYFKNIVNGFDEYIDKNWKHKYTEKFMNRYQGYDLDNKVVMRSFAEIVKDDRRITKLTRMAYVKDIGVGLYDHVFKSHNLIITNTTTTFYTDHLMPIKFSLDDSEREHKIKSKEVIRDILFFDRTILKPIIKMEEPINTPPIVDDIANEEEKVEEPIVVPSAPEIPQQIFNDIKHIDTIGEVVDEIPNPFICKRYVNVVDADLFLNKGKGRIMAHCVAADHKWSSGIVMDFIRNFGDLPQNANLKVGTAWIVRDVIDQATNDHIVWLVTKRNTNDKPTYRDIAAAVNDMYTKLQNADQMVCLPLIACGIDGKRLETILHIIMRIATEYKMPTLMHARGREFKQLHQVFEGMKDENITRFKIGHCIMQSYIEGARSIGIEIDYNALLVALKAHVLANPRVYTPAILGNSDIDEYIIEGVWNQDFSEVTKYALVNMYNIGYNILDIRNNVNVVIGENPRFTVNYNGFHYWFVGMRAGMGSERVLAKYQELVDLIKGTFSTDVAEISCAPGMLGNVWFRNNLPPMNGYIYVGATDADISKFNIGFTDSFKQLRNYEAFTDIPYHESVICDAASHWSELFYHDLAQWIKMRTPKRLLLKVFPPATALITVLEETYSHVIVYRAKNSSVFSGEIYLLLSGSGQCSIDLPKHGLQRMQVRVTKKQIGQFINSLQQTRDVTVMNTLLNKLRSTAVNDVDLDMQCLFGVAGSKKSTHAWERYGNQPNVFVMAPTTNCADDWRQRGAKHVYTQHVILLNDKRKDIIIADEATFLPVCYYAILQLFNPSAKIVCLGDNRQICKLDFKKLYVDMPSFEDLGIVNTLKHSYRMPQDIVKILNAYHNENYTTSSNVVNSIYKGDSKKKDKTLKYMSYNQDTKRKLIAERLDARTITSAQGSTYENAAFVIDDYAIETGLFDRPEQIYVAISRHTNKLVVYGNTDKIEQIFTLGGSILQTYEEFSEVRLHDDNILPMIEETIVRNTIVADDLDIDRFKATELMVVDVIKKCLPVVNEHFPLVSRIEPARLDPVVMGLLKIDPEVLTRLDKPTKCFKIARDFEVLRQAHSTSAKETVECVITRYAKKTKLHSKGSVSRLANKMLFTLAKKCQGNKDVSIDAFKRSVKDHCTEDRLVYHYKEYLRSLQTKISNDSKASVFNVEEIANMLNVDNPDIKFFAKKQGKYDPVLGFDAKIKAAQGVSAWSKQMNCIYAAYSRCLLECIMKLLPDNVIIATKDRDDQIGDRIAELLQRKKRRGHKYRLSDITEWDASFNDIMIYFEELMFEIMGMNDEMRRLYVKMRTEWKLRNPHFDFYGFLKQHSGQPFTFSMNTICNMILINMFYTFVDIILELYKGDDMAVLSLIAEMTDTGRKYLDEFGHAIKYHECEYGEFAGFFLTDYGMFPDIFRRMCKFLSKDYASDQNLSEAKRSVDQDLCCIKTIQAQNDGIAAMVAYYGHLGFTEIDALICLSYARRVHEVEFSKLYTVVREPMRIEN